MLTARATVDRPYTTLPLSVALSMAQSVTGRHQHRGPSDRRW